MEKIDWNHWFRYRTLKDWEVIALSLGINPMDIDVNSIGGINYILDEIIPKHKVEYESRMRLLQDFRDKPYSYFEGDDEAGNYFDASDSKFKKVLVKRFLLWLKNEDKGWTLPKELQAYIDKLDNPSDVLIKQGSIGKKGRPPALTEEKIAALIQMKIDKPTLSHQSLADEFKISRTQVGKLLRNNDIN
jgi:hypothetical protein